MKKQEFKEKTLICDTCGREVEKRSGRQKRCPECREKQKVVWSKERTARIGEMRKKDRPCAECGTMIYGVTGNTKLCPDCRARRTANCKKQYDNRRRTEEKEQDAKTLQAFFDEYTGYRSKSEQEITIVEMDWLAKYWKITYAYAVVKAATVSRAEIDAILKKRPKQRKKT